MKDENPNPWNTFLETGSVLDYLAYKSVFDNEEYFGNEPNSDAITKGQNDENYDGRSYNKGTKHW